MIQRKNSQENIQAIERAIRCAALTGCPSLNDVARTMRVSPRSLQRSLMENGTTFSRIVERYRRQTAFQLLLYEDMSISEIAVRVGYTDTSNFGRAFRKWTGQSPRKWRENLSGDLNCGSANRRTRD